MAYKILLTEQDSDLAKELLADFETLTFQLSTPDVLAHLSNTDNLAGLLDKHSPNVIINSLSYQQPELDLGPLAQLCCARDATLIHISSHEVFAASVENRSYLEHDRPNATAARGQALIAAELAVATVPRHLIVRLPVMVGPRQGNWLDEVCRALMEGSPVPVSETQRVDPLCIAEASRVVVALVQQILCGAENWGTLHLHTADGCSEAEVADHIARLLRKEHQIVAPLDPNKGSSKRLLSVGLLGGSLITNKFGVQMRSWRLGLKHQVLLWLEQYKLKTKSDEIMS